MNTADTQTGSRDQIFPPGSQVTDEGQSQTDFSGCRTRGNFKSDLALGKHFKSGNLEALFSNRSCIVEIGEGENKIQLRFFLKSEVNNYPGFERGSATKHLSLWCAVLKGGVGKHLAFAAKFEKLSENLKFQQALMTEKTIIINSAKDRQGLLIQSVFLPYFKTHIGDNGQINNNAYLWEFKNELCFWFTVTQLKCTGESRYGKSKGHHSMLDVYETA